MLKAGVSANQIAKDFGLSYAGAKKICARLKSSGDCHRTPGSGRKRKTSERTDRFIVRQSEIGTPTKKHLADSLEAQTGINASKSTIQRRLRENGMQWSKKTRKSFVSEKNRLKRLAFAREHVHWDLDQWKSVIWSDESPFTLQNNCSQFVWRNHREKNTSRTMQGTVKHQKSINVWSCFSWNGVGDLHRVKGIMTGPVYRQILIHHLVPSARRLCGNNFVFQHDNNPKHTSGVVQRYLANKKVNVMKWPAQSLDLNPIENLWAELNRITKERKPNNEDELFEVLKRGWELLSIEYLHSLIERMPRRCKAVVKAKGMPTKY